MGKSDCFRKKYCTQNGVNRALLKPESTLLIFFLNLSIRFFWNSTWWQTLKSRQKWLFWILKINSYFTQNGVNRSSVGTRVPLLLCTCFFCFRFSWRLGERDRERGGRGGGRGKGGINLKSKCSEEFAYQFSILTIKRALILRRHQQF